jgi:hypothetical protein
MAKQLNRPRTIRKRQRPSFVRQRLLFRRQDRQALERFLSRPRPQAVISRTYINPNPNPTFTFKPWLTLDVTEPIDVMSLGRGRGSGLCLDGDDDPLDG